MSPRRLFGAVIAFTAIVSLVSAAGSASQRPTVPGGTFRGDAVGYWGPIDPALGSTSSVGQLEYATCAKLVNYPDAPPPEGSRLVPEIAAAMPTVTDGGTTYTFQIRDDYAFSPPATGVVTAESMKWTFERTLSPALASPAQQFFHNIVGADAYMGGQANEITGIVAAGNTLTIHLIQPEGRFLSLLALPYLCAVPTSLPAVEQLGPIPSAGPYYISAYASDQSSLTALPNPNYAGSRPRPWDSLEFHFGELEQDVRSEVESGASDDGFYVGPWTDLSQLYGPGSDAASRGLQQWYPYPESCVGYIPLNTSRPTFHDVSMRKAVNYAIDRSALSATNLPYQAPTTDQYLPPGMPGYEDISAYPDTPNIEVARDLAGWQPGDPLRPITVYYLANTQAHIDQYTSVEQQLVQIGFEVTGVGFANNGAFYAAIGTRGEPFDAAVGPGWCEDWHDPDNFMQLFDGTTIQAENNINYAYFDDPVFNQRIHEADALAGDDRYEAYRQLEHDLVLDAAPWASWRLYDNSEFLSRRIGCQRFPGAYQGVDLLALCVRPEIRTDDAGVAEPPTGTTTVTVPVRLSSEMDGAVSVNYATADGTAHAGEDYLATSGTLTFAPHQRLGSVQVTVLSDHVDDVGETFSLNVSNETSGTIVDGQATVTILAPPPPPPPGEPPPPPPPPPPPFKPPKCVVPNVLHLKLAKARARLRTRHCRAGTITRRRSSRANRGRVLKQVPKASRKKHPNGFRVRLTIGR